MSELEATNYYIHKAAQVMELGARIGRKAAVADFGWVRLSGALAWWLWGAVHIAFLVGLRNRISVMWDWFWAYLSFRSGTRLITGSEVSHGDGQDAADLAPIEGVGKHERRVIACNLGVGPCNGLSE